MYVQKSKKKTKWQPGPGETEYSFCHSPTRWFSMINELNSLYCFGVYLTEHVLFFSLSLSLGYTKLHHNKTITTTNNTTQSRKSKMCVIVFVAIEESNTRMTLKKKRTFCIKMRKSHLYLSAKFSNGSILVCLFICVSMLLSHAFFLFLSFSIYYSLSFILKFAHLALRNDVFQWRFVVDQFNRMYLWCCSICVTVVVLNVHFRSPQTHRMAPWVKKVFINFLPKVLFIKRPQYNFETR